MTVTPPDLFQVEPNGLRSSRDIGKALPPGQMREPSECTSERMLERRSPALLTAQNIGQASCGQAALLSKPPMPDQYSSGRQRVRTRIVCAGSVSTSGPINPSVS